MWANVVYARQLRGEEQEEEEEEEEEDAVNAEDEMHEAGRRVLTACASRGDKQPYPLPRAKQASSDVSPAPHKLFPRLNDDLLTTTTTTTTTETTGGETSSLRSAASGTVAGLVFRLTLPSSPI